MTEFNEYYMLVALAVRERANCKGRRVGAIIVKDNRIIGTGYNGTPESMASCDTGGCVRCDKYRKKTKIMINAFVFMQNKIPWLLLHDLGIVYSTLLFTLRYSHVSRAQKNFYKLK